MDAARFDSLTKRLSDPQSRRRLLGGALYGIVAGAAAAVSGERLGRSETEAKKQAKAARKKGGNTTRQGQPKVRLCHKGKTLTVAEPAVPAHLRHGDTIGPCEATPPPECTTAATCPVPPQLCEQATCVDGKCGSGPKAAGTVCRAAAGECDVAEVCNGTALDCPANQVKPNQTPCSGGSCQNGRCTACATEGGFCASDEACCGELVCSDTGQCGCPVVACQGGTVNQDTCACECPTGFTPVNGECLVQTCTSGIDYPPTACDRGNGTKGYCCCVGSRSSPCGLLCSCCPRIGNGFSCSVVGEVHDCPDVPIGIRCGG
jgi:hypothetical protein